MFGRSIVKCAIVGVAAVALTGCYQMTRHSNTMVFGTNTVGGLDIGTDATNVPGITVGYNRQELVIMPLVANIGDNGEYQTPCNVGSVPDSSNPRGHPCLLVSNNGNSVDTYSVLASFGAEFSATANNPTASGGLAQFFATGSAAQILALRGGPALVAVGEAAERQTRTNVNGAIQQLFSNPEVQTEYERRIRQAENNRNALVAFLANGSENEYLERIRLVESKLEDRDNPRISADPECRNGYESCMAYLNSDIGLRFTFSGTGSEFAQAVDSAEEESR
ncbi:hypothetical protein [Parasphingopyxis sp.]|uniref:hypothetical protein n=1 Tax=Parasphingopyxis sp. TaxID=1920299 RepID=UPI00262950FB|nr:hypothetical protein [Parasphingopyxis sp.]